ncbi:MAG: Na+/H+ antiporter subunit D [Cellulomonas sp.]|jgi:multicomponent Na+:H+ antiporter subunit D|nr:Na+/H+ antiporter subunit D [Cellulomonas sp.]
MSWLVPLPVILPLLGAGLTLALFGRPRLQKFVSVTTLSAVLAVAVTLLVAVRDGPLVQEVGHWAAPVGIVVVADRLSALMLTVSAAVTLCVLVYSQAQGDDAETTAQRTGPVSIYHPTYLILTAGVANAFVSGDLFNIYVGFEVLLAASYVLLTLGGTAERIRAGSVYVVVAITSSLLFLIGIAVAYGATGTLNLAQMGQRMADVDPGVRLLVAMLLLIAFGIKAAVFPLAFWLPDSYPTAPAPVTAVFAGLLTKVGVYAMIRTRTLLFPEGGLDDVLMWMALATMLVGILGAVAQDDIKRLLSFTLISHIGFMVFGVALATTAAWSAAIYYVAHHITVQTALFLVSGLIERYGGTTSLSRLGGLAKASPVIAVLFFVPAINLAGIPPLSGFVGKVGLLQAGAQVGTPIAYVLIGGSVVTSLLTLYAMVKAWNKAFWQPAPRPLPARRVRRGMLWPAAALVVASLGLTAAAGPLYAYTTRTAGELIEREPYIAAVLPDGVNGRGASEPDPAPASDSPVPVTPASQRPTEVVPSPSPSLSPSPSPSPSPDQTDAPGGP